MRRENLVSERVEMDFLVEYGNDAVCIKLYFNELHNARNEAWGFLFQGSFLLSEVYFAISEILIS